MVYGLWSILTFPGYPGTFPIELSSDHYWVARSVGIVSMVGSVRAAGKKWLPNWIFKVSQVRIPQVSLQFVKFCLKYNASFSLRRVVEPSSRVFGYFGKFSHFWATISKGLRVPTEGSVGKEGRGAEQPGRKTEPKL